MKAVLAVLCMLLFLGSFYEASAQTCQTSGDCGNGYCCHSAMRPIGRRRQNGLTCQPRGQLNDGCLVPNSVYDANHVYYYCPCADGLICLGTGMIDVPLGETGVCVAP